MEVKFWCDLIRDEKNSSIFYSALAEKCKDERKRVLEDISVACGRNVWLLSKELCSMEGGVPFIKNGRVNTEVSLEEGIDWAIDVEEEIYSRIQAYTQKHKNKTLSGVLKDKNSRINKLKSLKYCSIV